jgi:hypothetical protein
MTSICLSSKKKSAKPTEKGKPQKIDLKNNNSEFLTQNYYCRKMTTPVPWTDEVLEYTHKGTPCRCGILTFWEEVRPLVILTNMGDRRSGFSLTQSFRAAAATVCHRFGFDPDIVVWIEHYEGNEAWPSTFAEVWNIETDPNFRGSDPEPDRETVEDPEAFISWVSDILMTNGPPLFK